MKTFLQALAISLELNLGLDQVLVPETHTENHECTKRVQIWFQTSNKVCITGTILTLRTRREVLSQLEKIIIQTALLKSPF